MIIEAAENFSGFKLIEDKFEDGNKISLSAQVSNIKNMIPESLIKISHSTFSSTTDYLYYGKQLIESCAPFDAENPDDKWLGITKSYTGGYTYEDVIEFPFTKKIGTQKRQCFSFSLAFNDAVFGDEKYFKNYIGDAYIFEVCVGDDKKSLFKMNSDKNIYVDNNAIDRILYNKSYSRGKLCFDIICRPENGNTVFDVYSNDINILSKVLPINYRSSHISIKFGRKIGSAAMDNDPKTHPLSRCPILIRDIVMATEEYTGEQIRMGSNFYVNKIKPVYDDEVQWVGEGSHAELMSRKLPLLDDGRLISAYKDGQFESYNMDSLTGNRGDDVLAVYSSINISNTGSVGTEIETFFDTVSAGSFYVDVGFTGTINNKIPLNPLTDRKWKVGDFKLFKSGFGIKS